MYWTEEFTNRTTMKDYQNNYESGASFLEYCEKLMGCDSIWSCPLYDFNPEEYGERYKYLYIIAKRIIFGEPDGVRANRRTRGKNGEEQKEWKRYMSQICLKEKKTLLKEIKSLAERYPDSFALSAGSCHVCSQCKRAKRGGCRYSDEIRFFIESLGCDVGETAGELLGIELQWMKQKLPEQYTLVTGLLTDHPGIER